MSIPRRSRWGYDLIAPRRHTWLMWLSTRHITWVRPKFCQEPRQWIAAREWEISKVEPPDVRELFLIMLQDRAELGPHHGPETDIRMADGQTDGLIARNHERRRNLVRRGGRWRTVR